MQQRQMLITLAKRFGLRNQVEIVARRQELAAAYAQCELRGEVPRDSNKYAMGSLKYADRLITDGLRPAKKSWLLIGIS